MQPWKFFLIYSSTPSPYLMTNQVNYPFKFLPASLNPMTSPWSNLSSLLVFPSYREHWNCHSYTSWRFVLILDTACLYHSNPSDWVTLLLRPRSNSFMADSQLTPNQDQEPHVGLWVPWTWTHCFPDLINPHFLPHLAFSKHYFLFRSPEIFRDRVFSNFLYLSFYLLSNLSPDAHNLILHLFQVTF